MTKLNLILDLTGEKVLELEVELKQALIACSSTSGL